VFIGHFAIALGAKKYAPQISLGILFLACQLADIIWPNLVLLGIEIFEVEPGNTAVTPLNFIYYPYSHSLVALLIWSVLFAAIYTLLRHSGFRAAIIIAVVVFSHWILDVITHAPDMPITLTGSDRIGLELWNHPYIAVPFELLLFAIGFGLYAHNTHALNKRGSLGMWGLAIFLVVIYFANIFGPPPPSVSAVAWSAQAIWLIVAWGFWVDRHRESITPGSTKTTTTPAMDPGT
jgi:membrane-bound metal-dependent hydrolase YbcI (DUF457 family)